MILRLKFNFFNSVIPSELFSISLSYKENRLFRNSFPKNLVFGKLVNLMEILLKSLI